MRCTRCNKPLSPIQIQRVVRKARALERGNDGVFCSRECHKKYRSENVVPREYPMRRIINAKGRKS